jgi:SAM-dependent methyltransferase
MTTHAPRERFYPESRFGGFTDIDGTIAFYTRVHSLLAKDAVVLDVGCGRGEYAADPLPLRRELRIFKGKYGRVIGLDTSESGRSNPFLDEFHRLEGERWPVPADSVDLCLADFVLEHVAAPDAFLAEAHRVLRVGGHLCMRTTNSLGYVALAARVVPNREHARVLGRVQDGRKPEDVFPTMYRCNTLGKLRRALRRHGFDAVVYGYEAEPSYSSFSPLFYALSVAYQRLAPRFLRNSLFAFARKLDPDDRVVALRTSDR